MINKLSCIGAYFLFFDLMGSSHWSSLGSLATLLSLLRIILWFEIATMEPDPQH
jgi:hypothetical protein